LDNNILSHIYHLSFFYAPPIDPNGFLRRFLTFGGKDNSDVVVPSKFQRQIFESEEVDFVFRLHFVSLHGTHHEREGGVGKENKLLTKLSS
jgi:hypothetical protein